MLILFIICACGENKNRIPSTETMDSGKVEVFCDSSYLFAMDSVFKMYQERYPKVELKINYVNARNVTSHLLSGKTRVAIIGRDYLKDEDSLLNQYNVPEFYKMEIVNDGLVFFTQADFPLDTINTDILTAHFTEHKTLQSMLPTLPFEPNFVIANQNSSEYGNFVNLVCNRDKIFNIPELLSNTDSVLEYVKNNPKAIGICYLSQVQGKFYKILRIGYNDTTGKYIQATKPPHQSFIVMNEYPYITTLRLYLQEDRKNLPFWFGAFCEKENISVNYYKQKRLVPCYATYQLDDQRRSRR
jgi:ABC-type phosphate transport system substrate-binding protein